MNKSRKTILSLLLLMTFSVGAIAEEVPVSEAKVELLPEVKAILEKPETLPDDFYENNLFIGLAGVLYPEDNFYEVATEIFKHNYPEYLKAYNNSKVTAKDLNLIKLKYKLPEGKQLLRWTREIDQLFRLPSCANYLLDDCITQTAKEKEKLQKLSADNAVLLAHYRTLAKNYTVHKDQFALMSKTKALMGSYHFILNSYQRGLSPFMLLTLNQAVFDLLDQKVDEGLENIQLAQSIVYTLFKDGKETSVVAMMMGSAYSQFIDQYMDALLSKGIVNDYLNDERVAKIVAPYPHAFNDAVHRSFVFEQDHLVGSAIYQERQTFDPAKVNELYQLRHQFLEAVDNGTITALEKEMRKACDDHGKYCSLFKQRDQFFNSYFTQRNYHNMIYLKYLILKDQIADKDIPDFLAKQGEIAIDPITQKAFSWDSKERTITLPLVEVKYLPSFVRSAVIKNPRIKHLQVTIPKAKDNQ